MTEFEEAVASKEAEIREEQIAAGEVEPDEDDEKPPIEVEWEGETIRAFMPEKNQIIFLMAQMGRGKRGAEKFTSMINVLIETLDEESREYVEMRMLQRRPVLEPEKIEELFSALSAEWNARPTE